MTWDFRPYDGYGPLRFGMSTRDAVDLLGTPSERMTEFDQLQHVLDQSLFGKEHISRLKRTVQLGWPDSATSNRRPAMVFLDGKLQDIHLQARNDSLVVHGINLWQRDRIGVITGLAAFEEVMLFSGADYYFESLGLRITAPKFWKQQGSIGLYSRDGFEAQMDNSQPYEYAPDEITGKES